MLSIQAVRGLPRLRAPGIVPCIISFSRQFPCYGPPAQQMRTLYFATVFTFLFFLLSFFLAYSQRLEIGCLPLLIMINLNCDVA